METLIDIIALASLAHITIEFIQGFNLPQLDFKPLNCNLCMGWWIGLPVGLAYYEWWGIPFAAAVGVTSEIIYKHLSRL